MNRGIMGKYWNMAQLNYLIKFYSMFGSWDSEILQLLNTKAEIIRSMGTLRWIFKKCGTHGRRKNESNPLEVALESRDSVISNPYQTLLLSIYPQSIAIFLREETLLLSHLQQTYTFPLFSFFSFYFCCLWKHGTRLCLGKLSRTKECWKNKRKIFDRKTPTCCSLSKSCECHVLRHPEWPWFESGLCVTNKGTSLPLPKIMRWILAKFWLCLFLVSHFCLLGTNLWSISSLFLCLFVPFRNWAPCPWTGISTSGKLSTTCAR